MISHNPNNNKTLFNTYYKQLYMTYKLFVRKYILRIINIFKQKIKFFQSTYYMDILISTVFILSS